MLRLHAALGWRAVLPVHGAAMPSSHDHSKPGRPTGTREAWIEMLHEDRGDLDSVLQEQYVAPDPEPDSRIQEADGRNGALSR